MMAIVLSVFGLIGATGSFLCGSSELLLVAALAAGLYALVNAVDCAMCLRVLRQLPGRARSESNPVMLRLRPLTSMGQRLLDQIEAVRYRVHSLHWKVEGVKATPPALAAFPIWEDLNAGYAPPQTQLAGLLKKTLDQIAQRQRCRQAAIVLLSEEDHTICTISSGTADLKLEGQLKAFFTPFFYQQRSEMFGLRDGLRAESVLDDFSGFGLRYTIALPFTSAKAGAAGCQSAGVLWLGFASDQPPLENELALVREWIPILELQVSSFQKLKELGCKAAEAENQSQEKVEVIAHMSHDIRSPLSNIKAVLNLFKVENLGTDNEELIDVALKNCDSMQEIVDDLLDYARHRMGRLAACRELVSIAKLVQEVVETYQLAARQKGLNLAIENGGCPEAGLIQADRRQTRRVVSNLVNNAIKYTARGAVEVRLQRCAEGRLELSVRDSGVGMSAEQVEKLFTPFTRFNAASAEGIGLGLALSKVLVELNGGRVSVASKPGQGSEFKVSWPEVQAGDGLAQSDQARGQRGAPSPLERPASAAAFAGKRILVVDDDVDCAAALARALQAAGCQVLSAVKVCDAESIINFEKLDLVISDAQMPGGGARRLLEFIGRRSGKLPVYVFTGGSDEEQKYLELGANHVLLKPVDLREVLGLLGQEIPGCFQEERQVMVA